MFSKTLVDWRDCGRLIFLKFVPLQNFPFKNSYELTLYKTEIKRLLTENLAFIWTDIWYRCPHPVCLICGIWNEISRKIDRHQFKNLIFVLNYYRMSTNQAQRNDLNAWPKVNYNLAPLTLLLLVLWAKWRGELDSVQHWKKMPNRCDRLQFWITNQPDGKSDSLTLLWFFKKMNTT